MAKGSHICLGGVKLAVVSLAIYLVMAARLHSGRTVPSAMRAEIAELECALADYKEKFGEYPPDNTSDIEAVRAHLAKAFPKCDLERVMAAVPKDLDQAAALVFWLGGPIDASGKQNGFSANRENPFDENPSRIGPFYDFNADRLKKDGGVVRYYPPGGPKDGEPYVYFRARPDGTYSGEWRGCKPCQDWRDGESEHATHMNPQSFQLRSPGLDGRHGSGVQFPTGGDYDKYQYDDLANFCEKTFGDKIP